MQRLTHILLPLAVVTAALFSVAPQVGKAADDLGDISISLDLGGWGDYVFGNFVIDGAIQDQGDVFGQYVGQEDGTRELQLTLSSPLGDLEIVIEDARRMAFGWFDTRLVSDGFALVGISGAYTDVLGAGTAGGYVSYTSSWWSWGYPSERENWFLDGTLIAP